MNIIQAVILGIVEGVTEFLPISSTAHLIITSKLLGIAQTEFHTFFEVFIQSGAILAVVYLYMQYLLKHTNVLGRVLASFAPTAVVGLLLHDTIKTVFFNSNALILFSMVSIAIVFLVVEFFIKNNKIKLSNVIEQMTYQDALVVGLAQSLAVVPGVSRAGIVIVVMMLFGYKRPHAAMYSFLLAMPTILAASALDLYKSRELLQSSPANIMLLGVGFVISFITALFAVRWLLAYLQKHTLEIFAYYRLILAIILVLIFGV